MSMTLGSSMVSFIDRAAGSGRALIRSMEAVKNAGRLVNSGKTGPNYKAEIAMAQEVAQDLNAGYKSLSGMERSLLEVLMSTLMENVRMLMGLMKNSP